MVRFAFRHIGKYRIKYIIYVIEICLTSFCGILVPILSGKIVDVITKENSVIYLSKICIIWCVVELLRNLFEFLSNKMYIFIETQSVYSINREILKHLHKISLSYMDGQDTVYLSSRIYNDSTSIISFSLSNITDSLSNGIFLLFSVLVICYINIYIGFFLIILLIIDILIYIFFENYIYKMTFINRENQDIFFSAFLEQLNNVRFIKRHELSAKLIENLNCKFKVFFENIMKSRNFLYCFEGLDSTLISVGKIIIYLMGGYSVINKNISIGVFVIVLNYFQNILGAVKYFTELVKKYKDSQVSYNRIVELLSIDENVEGEIAIKDIGEIRCKEVSFERADKKIINKFSYVFKKGKMYCFWGENGCGKSTLIDLLLGLYKNEYKGEISYNDIDISRINMIKAREDLISIIEQEPYLFTGSVKDNVLVTRNYKKDTLYDIIDKLEFEDMQDMLEEDKMILDDRRDLSGGEKQKLALLRMLSKRANVLILDEPTSALDDKSKNKLIGYLKSICEDKIIIIISHERAVASACDTIIKF